MQSASLAANANVGLLQTHGLVGSEEWWANIETGNLPLLTLRGTVSGFWPGHHDDFAEFQLLEDCGVKSMWPCMIPSYSARFIFQPGSYVEVDFVRQELKTAPGKETPLVVEIRVA